ncbi:MAG: hypothetical protein ACYCU5_09605, partial [Actinomycetes bacterium]
EGGRHQGGQGIDTPELQRQISMYARRHVSLYADTVETAATEALERAGASRWLAVTVTATTEESFRQERRGRPGPTPATARPPAPGTPSAGTPAPTSWPTTRSPTACSPWSPTTPR